MSELSDKNRLAAFWICFGSCIVLGPLNYVLYKILFLTYGDGQSFFVYQCINVMYVINGAIALWFARGEITDSMRQVSHSKYLTMGLLDFCGGFLSSYGAYYTPGASQQLFNQSLIPCTMIASYFLLGRCSSFYQIVGAIFVVMGSVVVMLPAMLEPPSTDIAVTANKNLVIFSCFVFCASNIPMAISYVYKEYGFNNLAIHVLYLTQWVSIYQLLFGFMLMAAQVIVGVSSWTVLFGSFSTGWYCFYQSFFASLSHVAPSMSRYSSYSNPEESYCATNYDTAWLFLVGYCFVNFVFNTLGLFVVKNGSAVINSISYAIILPLTTFAFSLPMLGNFQEKCSVSTLLGLVVTLVGFFIWRSDQLVQPSSGSKESSESEVDDSFVMEGFVDIEHSSIQLAHKKPPIHPLTTAPTETTRLLKPVNDNTQSTHSGHVSTNSLSSVVSSISQNAVLAATPGRNRNHSTTPDAFNERVMLL